jgi:flagellin
MSLNSVNTNIAAQVALQSLNATNTELQKTQKRISTGFRVADATDDGAAFAVAQKVRADVGSLQTVNQQLGSAKGLVGTAVTSLTNISNSVTQAKSLLVDIGNQSISDDQRNQYITSFKNLVTLVANSVDGSSYNGQTLLGQTGVSGSASAQNVINSSSGTTSTLAAEDSTTLANALASLIGLTFTRTSGSADSFGTVTSSAAQTAAASALSSTATTGFTALQSGVLTQLNQAGADSNLLDATISFNSSKIDSLNAGLGALIDADLSKESANLQALQIRQQLGTQSLSLANQAPQALLSLFK